MEDEKSIEALLVLEDGAVFKGKSIGVNGTAMGELCFNTGMTGYQEIFTDPSYFGQIMLTTNAHIGNYGVKQEEEESDTIKIEGLVCRNFSFNASRSASDSNLLDYFQRHSKVAITEVDTRAVVRHIRSKGTMNAIISTEISDVNILKEKLKTIPNMEGLELASKVSTKEPYFFGDPDAKYKISALDLGIKKNILRNLAQRDCYIKVFPYNTSYEDFTEFNPDGYFLSNGPGDPQPLKSAIELAKKLIENKKILFGICLGHQIIGLSQGISTLKMKNGHRGINHPVINLKTGKGEISSQNHGFVLSEEDVLKNENIEITHRHLNDNTIAGIKLKNASCFSVQYHPEAAPGPDDSTYLFDDFIEMIKNHKN